MPSVLFESGQDAITESLGCVNISCLYVDLSVSNQ